MCTELRTARHAHAAVFTVLMADRIVFGMMVERWRARAVA